METTRILVIPACEVLEKDSLSDSNTEKRLRYGASYYHTGFVDDIFVTGGIYLPPKIQTVPAGQLMAEWLEKHGIPRQKIIIEASAKDTFDNIKALLTATKDLPALQFTVVSHWQHCLRIWATLRLGYGIKAKFLPIHYKLGLKGSILEWCMFAYHLLDPRGTKFIAKANRKARSYAQK